MHKLSVIQSVLMYQSVVKVFKKFGLEFSILSFKVASVYMRSSDIFRKSYDTYICMLNKNTLVVKNVQGQEAALSTYV